MWMKKMVDHWNGIGWNESTSFYHCKSIAKRATPLGTKQSQKGKPSSRSKRLPHDCGNHHGLPVVATAVRGAYHSLPVVVSTPASFVFPFRCVLVLSLESRVLPWIICIASFWASFNFLV